MPTDAGVRREAPRRAAVAVDLRHPQDAPVEDGGVDHQVCIDRPTANRPTPGSRSATNAPLASNMFNVVIEVPDDVHVAEAVDVDPAPRVEGAGLPCRRRRHDEQLVAVRVHHWRTNTYGWSAPAGAAAPPPTKTGTTSATRMPAIRRVSERCEPCERA